MIEYSVCDDDGNVIQSGTAQDEAHVRQCFPMHNIEFGVARPVYRPVRTETYQDKRRMAYPSIGDQLDALWKGGDAAREMMDNVMSVKERYPKGKP